MSIYIQQVATYVAIATALITGVLLMVPQSAAAAYDIPAGGVELQGFAWSGYTQGPSLVGIGWISMNCSNTGTCGTSDYKVELDFSGNLTGYAWSSNVGWISFDPTGPYPTGSGVINDDAQATNGTFTGNLDFGGWARVCAAAANPATCSGSTNVTAGGWDGWIALSGTAAGGYGITMTPTSAANGPTNYAWGGSTVVGWIDFSASGNNPVTYNTSPTTPLVTFDCPDTSSNSGDPIVCSYSVDDPTATCELSNDQDSTTQTPLPSNSSLTVNPTVDTIYELICTNSSGDSSIPETEPIDVTPTDSNTEPVVAPNPDISITVPEIVRYGTEAEVVIAVISVGETICDVYGPGLTGTTFTVPAGGTHTTPLLLTSALTNSATVAVECSVENGSPYRQGKSIDVTPAVQEI
jgi:hypothetical protein